METRTRTKIRKRRGQTVPDIHIKREHDLGMTRARKVAEQWAEQVKREHGLTCTLTRGRTEDVTAFAKPGLNGTVTVTSHTVVLEAKLGFLLGLFRQRITDAVTRVLDGLLGDAGGAAQPEKSAKGGAKAPGAKQEKAVKPVAAGKSGKPLKAAAKPVKAAVKAAKPVNKPVKAAAAPATKSTKAAKPSPAAKKTKPATKA
ncbi:polyhydroxyalkanoic acid system family protein [Variovorax sp. J22R133]|uniref:polyhydroxyalkanoic acid system family protein n=1 Tax=Variovorax brevis TaxID=3053503 RepID=UPI0025774B70|nr:polyhydroxyalkanoic acid system family protein [Variovorax sp. J22R133]MDM0114707.1 polyhydroxyalkanoic acid system family protein [Variovorax sp. J22R133]